MLQTFNPANKDLLININGRLIHRDEAGISPFDSAVQGGDAVWEGLRVYDGRIFRLKEHLDRLRGSALALAFAQIPSHDEITREIRRTLEANQMRDNVHIRLTLTRGVKITSGMDPRLNQAGPTLIVLAEHKRPVYDDAMKTKASVGAGVAPTGSTTRAAAASEEENPAAMVSPAVAASATHAAIATSHGGLTLATASIRRFPPDCLDPKIHHCNLIQSILAKIEANAAGADDAIMLDTRGFVAETNATHVFIVVEGEPVHTPGAPAAVVTPRAVACPEGITRAAVLDLCRRNEIAAVERDLSLVEVYRARECFCTGTMGEIAWVSRVDGRVIGDGRCGEVTTRLRGLFRELTRTEGERVVE